jgi:hypothetical protein
MPITVMLAIPAVIWRVILAVTASAARITLTGRTLRPARAEILPAATHARRNGLQMHPNAGIPCSLPGTRA